MKKSNKCPQKPKRYWTHWDNILKTIEPVIEELNRFPTVKELNERKLYSLVNGIQKYHGGMTSVAKKLGYSQVQKPKGYWDQEGNIISEIEFMIGMFGHFPTRNEMKKANKISVYHAIMSKYKNINEFKRKFGYPINYKTRGYWEDKSNVDEEIRKVIEDCGHIPTQKIIASTYDKSLPDAILEHYGGLDNCREAFGFKAKRYPTGYWRNKENVDNEIKKLIEEHNGFPPFSVIKEEISSLYIAMRRFYGGYNNCKNQWEESKKDVQLESLLDTYLEGDE